MLPHYAPTGVTSECAHYCTLSNLALRDDAIEDGRAEQAYLRFYRGGLAL